MLNYAYRNTMLVSLLACCTSQAFVVPSTAYRIRPLTFSNIASPFEEMEKEDHKNRDDDDDDWTKVEGGFLPKIGRRTSKQELITEVMNLEDYKKEVVDCDEELVIVKFYSTWCRSCKAMAPLYKRLANSLLDNPKIKFVQVPVTQANAVLHTGLGVPSVPFGHIYHKDAGLVEELKLNKKDFGSFKDILGHYVDGECDTNLAP